ncbi:GerAB/ArcD/ProY family transporter [Paenibacillus sp. TH7-28]
MLKNITSSQVYSLYNLQIFTTVIAFFIGIMIAGSKYSTPVATLIGGLLALMLVYPAYKVGASRPGEFLVQYGGELVGRPLHYCFILYIVLVHILLAALSLRELADYLLSEYLIDTPGWAVVGIFGICVAYAVRCGLYTIFLAAEGIFLVTALAFLSIPLIGFQEMEVDMFIALATHLTLKDLWDGIYETVSIFGELAFLFLLFPYLRKPKKVYRTYFFITCTSLAIIITHVIPVLLTFGPSLGANLIYPDMELVRFIRVGSFIDTMDPILIILWLTSIFVKISFIVFTAVTCLSQLTGVNDHKPFTLPVVAFILVFSICIVRTPPELTRFLSDDWPALMIFAEFLIPFVYWMAGIARGSIKKAKAEGH